MLIPLIVAATLSCDVAVVGGGSAGFAAALAAAENGSDTILIEKEDILGGTSTICGVNNWEPVCGATGTSRRVYERLAAIPGACGIWYQKYHSLFGDRFPGAFLEIDDTLAYEDTLRRHGPSMTADVTDWQERYHGISFEPDELDRVMRQMLSETGRCRVFTSVAYSSCAVREGKIAELHLSNGKVIRPKIVIDACGFVAKDAGCASEMSANPNSVTLLFRVSSDPNAPEIAVPDDTPDTCWWATSFPQVWCAEYPNGDRNVNMLPTMTGSEAVQLGSEAAYAECRRRVFAQWKWMKANYPDHFGNFKICEIFPRLGYRETHRIVCEHMLTGAEVKNGAHFDDEIATADHAFDSHGTSTAYSGELSQPYGIPLRSLKPIGVSNLYVAGRIAGFDEAAASSCRLSRTMMELGAAAGKAAAQDAAGELHPVDIRVRGTNVVITVAAGVAEEEDALWLGYGSADAGTSLASWTEKVLVAASILPEGGSYEVAIPSRGGSQTRYLRAFVAREAEPVALRTDNRSYIDLNETPVPGRRYEIRLSYANWSRQVMCFTFGGVGRTGGAATSMFQVYACDVTSSGIYTFFAGSQGDAAGGACPLFAAESGKVMDVRIDYGANSQSYFYKPADAMEYTKAGETAIDHETAGYKDDLYLFARNDGGPKFTSDPFDAFVTIYGYKVTDISSGEVVKNLVPCIDGQRRGEMVDTVTGTPYQNAGSGAFTVVYNGGKETASPLACYEGVRIEATSSRALQVTVDPGISDGTSSLLLCWGETDEGAAVDAWQHSTRICDTVPVEGVVKTASCRHLGVKPTDVIRAVLAPYQTYRHVDACRSNGGAIDLGKAVASGRQYDFRCKFNTVANGVSLFGGLVRGTSNKILQLYLIDSTKVQVWLGDATAHDFFAPKIGTPYDVRIVLGDGEQKAYVKKATESEYELKASASVAEGVSTDIHLALLGRYDGGTLQTANGIDFCFDDYKETDLATGEVLRELVPVRYGDNDAQTGIYDVTRRCLHSGVSGSLAYSSEVLQEYHAYGEATGVSSPFRMPETNQGLIILLK